MPLLCIFPDKHDARVYVCLRPVHACMHGSRERLNKQTVEQTIEQTKGPVSE